MLDQSHLTLHTVRPAAPSASSTTHAGPVISTTPATSPEISMQQTANQVASLAAMESISSSLTAAIDALKALSTTPEQVSIENAPEVSAEAAKNVQASLMTDEGSADAQSKILDDLRRPWRAKSHKQLKEEFGDVVDELSKTLEGREKVPSEVPVPAKKEAEISVEVMDTTPIKTKLSKESYGDLFKDALSNLSSLMSSMESTPSTSKQMIKQEKKSLSTTEEQIYVELTIKYREIMEEGKDISSAEKKWEKILPDLLKKHKISESDWTRISNIGDDDLNLQKYIEQLSKMET